MLYHTKTLIYPYYEYKIKPSNGKAKLQIIYEKKLLFDFFLFLEGKKFKNTYWSPA